MKSKAIIGVEEPPLTCWAYRTKARDETAKEIAKELERLALEEDKLREEALAQARARALKKIEVPELNEEQLAEVRRAILRSEHSD